MPLTHENHYVPRLYLKNFASLEGEICVYRTLVSHADVHLWRRFNATGMSYQKDLYTRIASGLESDEIELWMNREFETPAQAPIEKVIQDEELDTSDWHRLIRFLAAQAVRTPAFLVEHLRQSREMMPSFMSETMKEVENEFRSARESGREIALDEVPHAPYFPLRIDRADIPEENSTQITAKVVVGRGLWFYTMKVILTQSKSLNALGNLCAGV